MKAAIVTLAVAMLLSGCYSMTPLGQDEAVPPDCSVRFRLHDGMEITTDEGGHTRTLRGYNVTGECPVTGFDRFDSTLYDAMIDDMQVLHQTPSGAGNESADQGTIVFVLRDGRKVMTSTPRCRRITDGFEIHGRITRATPPGPFSGFVADSTIQEVLVRRFNTTKTIIAVGVPVVVATAAWIIISNLTIGGYDVAAGYKMF